MQKLHGASFDLNIQSIVSDRNVNLNPISNMTQYIQTPDVRITPLSVFKRLSNSPELSSSGTVHEHLKK